MADTAPARSPPSMGTTTVAALGVVPGTSGSPIFDATGVVVGLVAGGALDPDSPGESTRSGVNWGISAVAIQELLAQASRRIGP